MITEQCISQPRTKGNTPHRPITHDKHVNNAVCLTPAQKANIKVIEEVVFYRDLIEHQKYLKNKRRKSVNVWTK
jgi:hypothetical protein